MWAARGSRLRALVGAPPLTQRAATSGARSPHGGRLMTTPREILKSLFETAVAAAHPANVLPPHLPPAPSSGRLVILAGGKAAGSMAEVAEPHYVGARPDLGARLAGIAVTRHGYGRPTQIVEMVEAGHPV